MLFAHSATLISVLGRYLCAIDYQYRHGSASGREFKTKAFLHGREDRGQVRFRCLIRIPLQRKVVLTTETRSVEHVLAELISKVARQQRHGLPDANHFGASRP